MTEHHTPGPWAVDIDIEATFENDGRTETVLEITNRDFGNSPAYATSEADARLIAAAPDLLEVLEEMLLAAPSLPIPAQDGSPEEALYEADKRARKQARAVIAKATGAS